MSIVSITWARNECDILEPFVRHHCEMVDRMIVILHRCADNSKQILQALRSEGLPIEIGESDTSAHLQGEALTTVMNDIAANSQTEWIVPLDADEFLLCNDLANTLSNTAPNYVSAISWRTYVPTLHDDNSPHLLHRIVHRRKSEPRQFWKVLLSGDIVRRCDSILPLGSHKLIDATTGQLFPSRPQLAIKLAHFPVRSERQLRTKIIGGWLSHCANPNRQPGQVFHWEQLFSRCSDPKAITAAELQSIAQNYALFENDVRDPPLVRDPVDTSSKTLLYEPQPIEPLEAFDVLPKS